MNKEDIKLYEQEMKDVILEKKHIFLGENGKSTVLFEKGIVFNSTITDCLIFSEEKGIIGIEIKTEYDSTRRLNKQLRNYSVVCDIVYVLCHDNHVDATEKIIKDHKHQHVGILAYTEFQGDAILGVYKEAHKSPVKNVHTAFNMLWKAEISNLLGGFKRQMNTLQDAKGLRVESANSRSHGLHGLYVQSNASLRYLKKSDMIRMIVSRLGPEEANKVLCDIFISERMHMDKVLRFHHFKEKGKG